MQKLKLAAASILLAGVFFTTVGCSGQSKHPNQINSFDGTTYDALTVAHAALASLRTTISTTEPGQVAIFNQAANAYQTAFEAYSAFRLAPSTEVAVALAMNELTSQIVSLESGLQTDMHANTGRAASVRARAQQLRAHISLPDLLTELEIAATIAMTIPGTEPYSTVAALVIKATEQAVAALNRASGAPIDLSTIAPVLPLS
jgi:hypothetical protein